MSAYPSNSQTIPDDIVQSVGRLINEVEDQLAAAQDDKKQLYADLREQLKGLGWAGSTISAEIAGFKAAIAEQRRTGEQRAKIEGRDERAAHYLEILSAPRARARGDSETEGYGNDEEREGGKVRPAGDEGNSGGGYRADQRGPDGATGERVEPEGNRHPGPSGDEAEPAPDRIGAVGSGSAEGVVLPVEVSANVTPITRQEEIITGSVGREFPNEENSETPAEGAPAGAAVRFPADPLRSEAATREDAGAAAPVPTGKQWKHSDPAHPDCLDGESVQGHVA